MIVIMRDAIMPDCCNTCVCSEGYGCGITSTIMTTKEMESRPDWCPLEQLEPCEDAVSREALRKAMYHRAFETDGDTMWQSGCWIRYRAVEQVIKESPSVTPERKTGKWVHGREIAREMVGDAVAAIFYEGWQCSECKCIVEEEREPLWNFCPNCGARMKEEDA